MADRGITVQPQNQVAGMLGETAGMVVPIAAAAKAPQIAAGMLQAGQNMAAPQTLNPQTGAIVWHGSPHKFDAFDSSKIGTGEGAQAYGHGLYLAETPEVARTYKSAGANPSTFVTLRSIRDPAQMASTALERAGGDMRHALAVLTQNAQSGDMTAGAALQLLKQRAALPESKYAGSLYKVDLPDEKIARMLDWDKQLSQQAPEVREAAEALGIGKPVLAGMPARQIEANGLQIYNDLSRQTRGPKSQADAAAAKRLRELGIPGIRFLDGNSRGAGVGSSNFVVFPGEEGTLKILERNGQRLSDLGKK
jgi:hypothetical protein